MKRIIVSLAAIMYAAFSYAQVDLSKISSSNTWAKFGVNAAVPIGNLAETHSFGAGLDLSVQFLETKASGIGLKAGFINYFGKDNVDNASLIPLAIMYRYYPESKGWFAGLEAGYAFASNLGTFEGGAFVRPQVGLHFDKWNFFLYYDRVVAEDGLDDLEAIGVGALYNIHFKKK